MAFLLMQVTCDFCNEPYTFSEESIVQRIDDAARLQVEEASLDA